MTGHDEPSGDAADRTFATMFAPVSAVRIETVGIIALCLAAAMGRLSDYELVAQSGPVFAPITEGTAALEKGEIAQALVYLVKIRCRAAACERIGLESAARFERWAEVARHAIETPVEAQAMTVAAYAAYRSGQTGLAHSALERALELNPDLVDARAYLDAIERAVPAEEVQPVGAERF
ncbi:DUF4192 family protein [Glycomyces sp. MUSA5-2]|uniref:DUF4192 family protein n=1 Tax=Glycomyces sp. MUSA5-2 TaxID=2053002 RepID=UPI00300A19CC